MILKRAPSSSLGVLFDSPNVQIYHCANSHQTESTCMIQQLNSSIANPAIYILVLPLEYPHIERYDIFHFIPSPLHLFNIFFEYFLISISISLSITTSLYQLLSDSTPPFTQQVSTFPYHNITKALLIQSLPIHISQIKHSILDFDFSFNTFPNISRNFEIRTMLKIGDSRDCIIWMDEVVMINNTLKFRYM